MRHVLIAASLLLASLLLVQVVAAAFQVSATRGHEVTDNFVPGELPRSALPAVLGPTVRANATAPERERGRMVEPRTGKPLDYRQPLATQPQQPAAQDPAPAPPKAPAAPPPAPAAQQPAPPSLKLPAPSIRNALPEGADRV